MAASAEPDSVASFNPKPVHHAVAGALFGFAADETASIPLPTTFQELAVASGVSLKQIRTILDSPAACAWIVNKSASICKLGLAAVYSRLQHMALTSKNSNWALLFLRRFDPEFQRQSSPGATFNQFNNTFQDYSDQELLAHVAHAKRKRGVLDVPAEPKEVAG